jgi:hypothetical protein
MIITLRKIRHFYLLLFILLQWIYLKPDGLFLTAPYIQTKIKEFYSMWSVTITDTISTVKYKLISGVYSMT